jgi:acetyl-CoA carboxylase biotin carboxyl carrier protein
MPLTFKDVAEILKVIDASQCEEVVIELEGLRLVVRRSIPHGRRAGGDASALPAAFPAPSHLSGGEAASPARASGLTAADVSVAEGHVGVRAPMVGTFYRRSAPHEAPFVDVGTRVAEGDPLCLIEVMKLYTTIAAPAAGVVASILAEDGAAVEFDQLLFVIKADAQGAH